MKVVLITHIVSKGSDEHVQAFILQGTFIVCTQKVWIR